MSHDALSRIRGRGHIGIRLGLERMRHLLANLGDPQVSLRGALIGGTNGKGSVAAMVASVLAAAGWHTSQSPSPHLESHRERITIDGRPIHEDDLDALLDEVLRASQPGEIEHGPATEFELFVAAAFLWSVRRSVDAAVIEVGLGGRLDATNTWQPTVAAITNVGLDHQAFLGDTLEAVAAEKAAIIKPDVRAVTGADGVALDVIAAQARKAEAPLTVCAPLPVTGHDLSGLVLQHERMGPLRLGLLGRHQAHNAAVAIGVIEALAAAGVTPVDDAALRRGLADVRWPGRLELLERGGRPVLLDGAHNPDGAAALALALEDLAPWLPGGRATLLLAMLADKDVAGVLDALAASRTLASAQVVATSAPDTDRSLPPFELAAAWRAATTRIGVTATVEAIMDPDEALARALRLSTEEGALLVISGSLYLVGHARSRLVPVVPESHP